MEKNADNTAGNWPDRISRETAPMTLGVALTEGSQHSPPKKAQPSLNYLIGSLIGGNSISMIVRLVAGVLQGRIVAPAVLGLFNGIGLSLGYAPWLQLGILNGLNRELPYYTGQGNHQRVKELASAAQAWALAVGGASFLILSVVAGWQLFNGELWKAAGWFTNAILAFLVFYSSHYLQMTFRSSHDFARLALVNVVESCMGLALLALVMWFNFYGLCLRAVLTAVVCTAILFYWRPVRIGPHWNVSHLKHLLKIGAPIFGVGMLYSSWNVVNSTLVLRFAGVQGMGLYAMVLMAGSTIELIPSAVSQVVYPRMAEQYGRNHNLRELAHVAWKPTVFTVIGLIPVVVIGWFLVGPVVKWVVPAYQGAVPAMKWGLILAFSTAFSPLLPVFNVVRRQDLYVVAMLVGMAANIGCLWWLLRDKVSLEAFPQAMLVGRVVFMAFSYAFLARMGISAGSKEIKSV